MLTHRLFVLILVAAAVVSLASSNGAAEEQNRDRTGSPDGSTSCIQCHNSGFFNLIIDFKVRDSNGVEVTTYIPGQTYDLRFMMLTLAGPSASAYGFQATALLGDLSDAGEFGMPGSNVQVEEVNTAIIPSRHMAEHSQPAPSGIFEVQWTAPFADQGDVTFYYAATAVNLDDDNSGDNATNGAFTLTPAVPDGLMENTLQGLTVQSTEQGILLAVQDLQSADRVSVYDSQGGLIVFHEKYDLNQPVVLAPRSGLFILSVENEGKIATKKIVLN